MNPGGRFAPQSQLSETAKDGALLRGFWGAPLDLGLGSGGSRFPSADCGKNPAKKGDGLTDGHDSVGVPQIRDPLRIRPIRQDGLYCPRSFGFGIFSSWSVGGTFETLQNHAISDLRQ